MNSTLKIAAPALLAGATFFAGTVHSATLNNSLGLVAPSQTINFGENSPSQNTSFGNLYSGITFTALYATSIYGGGGIPNFNGLSAANFLSIGFPTPPSLGDPVSVSFAQPISAIAVAAVTAPGFTTFEAYLGNALIESFTASTDNSSNTNFFGFTGIVFNKLVILPGTVDGLVAIDNLQFTSAQTPEPGSLALLALGGAFLPFRQRRELARA